MEIFKKMFAEKILSFHEGTEQKSGNSDKNAAGGRIYQQSGDS